MKLQILIPHWQETRGEMEPLLDSLAIQQAIDFKEIGVIVAYDGSDAFSLPVEEWAAKYPFAIEHVYAPKGGVSATRNFALDHSSADYVMFCDADDMLFHNCALHVIFAEIERGFDTLVSAFIEETRNPQTHEPLFVPHEMDSTFVHGKVHRRAYLIDNGIRFNPALTVHEDSYFNILAQNLTDNAKYCAQPFYLWKWRDSSVCRHDPDYILKTYNNMLDSNDALVREFERRGKHDKALFYVAFMVLDAYYTMNKREWLDKTHKGYRDAVEQRFARYYADHKAQWDEVSDADRMMISNGVRQRSVMEGMPMESITIDAWLSHISKTKERQ